MRKYFLLVFSIMILSVFSPVEVYATGLAKGNDTNPPVTVQVTTFLPDSLTTDNPINPSQKLETFLNSCSDKKVVFPANKIYVLEKQIIINNISNVDIDFNGCTFQLPDNCAWGTRYISSYSIGLNPLSIFNCTNINIKNLIIDGNKANILTTKWCIGLWIQSTTNLTATNIYLHDCNYHHIVIYPDTKNIRFYGTKFSNLGSSGGCSDVYVSNNIDDNFEFRDTNIKNDSISNTAQVFYIHGYNGIIDGVKAENIYSCADFRRGNHSIKNISVNKCNVVFFVGADSNEIPPSVNISNVNVDGSLGQSSFSGHMYVTSCSNLSITNMTLNIDPQSTIWFGIKISKRYSDLRVVSNVNLNNVTVVNSNLSGIFVGKLTESMKLQNCKVIGMGGASNYAYRSDSNTAKIMLLDCVAVNTKKIYSPDKSIINSNTN